MIKALDAGTKFLPEIPITYFLRSVRLRQYEGRYALLRTIASSSIRPVGSILNRSGRAKHRLIALEPKK